MNHLTSYPQWVTACKTIVQYHHQDIHTDKSQGTKHFQHHKLCSLPSHLTLSFIPGNHESILYFYRGGQK